MNMTEPPTPHSDAGESTDSNGEVRERRCAEDLGEDEQFTLLLFKKIMRPTPKRASKFCIIYSFLIRMTNIDDRLRLNPN